MLPRSGKPVAGVWIEKFGSNLCRGQRKANCRSLLAALVVMTAWAEGAQPKVAAPGKGKDPPLKTTLPRLPSILPSRLRASPSIRLAPLRAGRASPSRLRVKGWGTRRQSKSRSHVVTLLVMTALIGLKGKSKGKRKSRSRVAFAPRKSRARTITYHKSRIAHSLQTH
jgi:hypothetical protein